MPRIAVIKGANLRDDGNVLVWEELNRTSDYDVVAFASDPTRYDPSGIDLPVRKFQWPDGRFDLLGHEYFFSKALRKARLPSNFLRGVEKIAEDFDVLHANENFNGFSIQAALASRNSETKFTFTAGENIPYPMFQHNPLLLKLKQRVNATADGITTTTRVGKRALIHEGVPHNKIDVVPNSVQLDTFQPDTQGDPAQIGLPDEVYDEIVISFVHKPSKQKGTPYLIEAFERLQKRQDHLRLVLVGTSTFGPQMMSRIENNEKINWIERIPHDDMPMLYGLSDIFTLPSVTMTNNEEQFGMGLLEAMASGLPAVVTDIGGLPYVADPGETALVVKERSSEELADALRRLITNPDLRDELGAAGRGRAATTFAPEHVAASLESFYDEVLK